jgi:predicted ATPase with chaperone activity
MEPEQGLREAISITRMYHVTGRTGGRPALVTSRPCRAPHHVIPEALSTC